MACQRSKSLVVERFEITPKAFANFSPGFERSENPGAIIRKQLNPERVRLEKNPFRVVRTLKFLSQGSRYARTLG